MGMLHWHGLQLENVILTEFKQGELEQGISLVNLCQVGLDILSDEELTRQKISDQLFRQVVAQESLLTLLGPAEMAELPRDIETVKFHHGLNQPPKNQRSEGRQPKYTRARMRGKKK
jgi:hypothetical protein